MRMKKKPLNLLVSKDLVKKAREYNINCSAFFEIKLREYFALIENNQKVNILSECGRRESNPGRGLGRP